MMGRAALREVPLQAPLLLPAQVDAAAERRAIARSRRWRLALVATVTAGAALGFVAAGIVVAADSPPPPPPPTPASCDPAAAAGSVAALQRLYRLEGVTFRGFETCGGWTAPEVNSCLTFEFGTGHAPTVSRPATFIHPNLSMAATQLYGGYFQGTPSFPLDHKWQNLSEQMRVYSVFRGCQPCECSYPQDAYGQSGCGLSAGMCGQSKRCGRASAACATAKGAAAWFLAHQEWSPDHRDWLHGNSGMCAFEPDEPGTRKMVATQNAICAVANGSLQNLTSNWCSENQRQLRWRGHGEVVALAFINPHWRNLTVRVARQFRALFNRSVQVVFPRYEEGGGDGGAAKRGLRFDAVPA